jgi:limonene-1,2-epoxide hydrolase
MDHIFLKSWVIIFTILIVNYSNAQTSDESKEMLVNTYLSLYTSLKFDEMTKYYSDNSIFEDPTMSFFNEDKSYEIITGPKNINTFLKEAFKKITDVSFKIEKQYNAGVIFFYYGTFNYKYDIGKDNNLKIINLSLPLAIILTVKDNKIIHHQDIADYNLWFKQYNQQLKQ